MSDIASRVKAIIVDKLGVDENEVVTEASFTNDLGADSLDTVELIMEFEKEFDTQQIVNAAKDGYTAYNVASIASNYGKEVVVDEAGKKLVEEQTAKEGLKKMGSDWSSNHIYRSS